MRLETSARTEVGGILMAHGHAGRESTAEGAPLARTGWSSTDSSLRVGDRWPVGLRRRSPRRLTTPRRLVLCDQDLPGQGARRDGEETPGGTKTNHLVTTFRSFQGKKGLTAMYCGPQSQRSGGCRVRSPTGRSQTLTERGGLGRALVVVAHRFPLVP